MSVAECLLIVIGLSLNIFLVSEQEGAMLRRIDGIKFLGLCGIFFACQIVSMMLGYLITRIPFFMLSSSDDLKTLRYVLASLIFLMLAFLMIRKAWKREIVQERLSEIRYKEIFLEAVVIGGLTFLAGIGSGFLELPMGTACITVACATVAAVVSGIYMGFYQGCKFRTGIYGAGGMIFLFVGIDILVKYLPR